MKHRAVLDINKRLATYFIQLRVNILLTKKMYFATALLLVTSLKLVEF